MGIRVDIEWEFISPLLRRASGIVKVWDMHNSISTQQKEWDPNGNNNLILECRCHIEQGSNGFSGMEEYEGVPTKLFNIYGDTIRAMMKAFFDGMILRNKQFHWIEESLHGEKLFQIWKDMQVEKIESSGA